MNPLSLSKIISAASLAAALFAAGTAASFQANAEPAAWGETLPALQIQVDASRNRVWVLTAEGLHVYDSAARKLVWRIELPDWVVVARAHSCAPALVLTPAGSALVTSNTLPILWEVDGTSLAVRKVSLTLNTDANRDVGFTGLAYARGGRDLYGVSSTAGSAWRIDLVGGKASKVRLAQPVQGACGVNVLAAVGRDTQQLVKR